MKGHQKKHIASPFPIPQKMKGRQKKHTASPCPNRRPAFRKKSLPKGKDQNETVGSTKNVTDVTDDAFRLTSEERENGEENHTGEASSWAPYFKSISGEASSWTSLFEEGSILGSEFPDPEFSSPEGIRFRDTDDGDRFSIASLLRDFWNPNKESTRICGSEKSVEFIADRIPGKAPGTDNEYQCNTVDSLPSTEPRVTDDDDGGANYNALPKEPVVPEGIDENYIKMPSWEYFHEDIKDIQVEVLPETSIPMPWKKSLISKFEGESVKPSEGRDNFKMNFDFPRSMDNDSTHSQTVISSTESAYLVDVFKNPNSEISVNLNEAVTSFKETSSKQSQTITNASVPKNLPKKQTRKKQKGFSIQKYKRYLQSLPKCTLSNTKKILDSIKDERSSTEIRPMEDEEKEAYENYLKSIPICEFAIKKDIIQTSKA